jgi:hypothetical protein
MIGELEFRPSNSTAATGQPGNQTTRKVGRVEKKIFDFWYKYMWPQTLSKLFFKVTPEEFRVIL